MRLLHLVTGLLLDILYKQHLFIGILVAPLVAQTTTPCLYSKRTYRGKLVVELRQHGIMDEDGRVLLKTLQLLHETLLVFLTAVPGGHRLEQGLPCSITPLKDHHLSKKSTQSNVGLE